MRYIQREIDLNRCSPASLQCVDASGRPMAGARVTLEQQTPSFAVGAAWAGEGARALATLARLPGALLAPAPQPPELRQTALAAGVEMAPVLPAPGPGQSLARWTGTIVEPALESARDLSVAFWCLDPQGNCGAGRLAPAIAALKARATAPIALLGGSVTRPSPPVTADSYGLDLGADGAGELHLAVLRRRLVAAVRSAGSCFLYNVDSPRLSDPDFLPAARRLGGQERVEADWLAQLATVCFSVRDVSGLFLRRLAAPNTEPDAVSLLAPDLRPKRSAQLLRGLLQHEWRTHASGITGADGTLAWEGFHGSYRVCVTHAGTVVETRQRLGPPGPDSSTVLWRLVINDGPVGGMAPFIRA